MFGETTTHALKSVGVVYTICTQTVQTHGASIHTLLHTYTTRVLSAEPLVALAAHKFTHRHTHTHGNTTNHAFINEPAAGPAAVLLFRCVCALRASARAFVGAQRAGAHARRYTFVVVVISLFCSQVDTLLRPCRGGDDGARKDSFQAAEAAANRCRPPLVWFFVMMPR